MPNTVWLFRLLETTNYKDEDKTELLRFWQGFYNSLLSKYKQSEQQKKTKSLQYKEEVFDILNNSKARFPLSYEELRKIQIEIEDLTMIFDEESMFKTAPNIIKILIGGDTESAKDYLRKRSLSESDMTLLSEFGQYTIEALIVYVLSMVFTSHDSNSMIRVASLVEQLESNVRLQALLFKSRRCKQSFSTVQAEVLKSGGKDRKRSKLEMMYPFGAGLVQFMEDRDLITLTSDLSGSARVKKKHGDHYLQSNLFAVCNFDISLLPIKFNLPMVCEPVDWTSACMPGQKPRNLSDLTGGYLSGLTGEIYDRYRLLSSGNINHFYIDISRDDNCEKLCGVMNKLQRQPFQINSKLLEFIQKNENVLVEIGLLMPRFLGSMDIKEVSILLREFYMKDEVINKLCSFSELLHTMHKNIQRSRYENFIINLASAYEGYQFYLPAFLDFRGRIYRSGILHFHERDLARSLILFANGNKSMSNKELFVSIAAAGFHYKSFDSDYDAYEWVNNNFYQDNDQTMINLFTYAMNAKRPFQFIANLIGCFNNTPITQDASASAYQIMSYFLLDETLAKRTNLIPSSDGKILDVYSFILEELKEFMKAELDINLSTLVCKLLTRKIVKGIFMPIIYGKTLMSTAGDLKENLSHYITHKECFDVASVCFKFWRIKYQNMESLIRLIRNIGWIASARDCPVFYKVKNFTTVQDYMIMEPFNIWVYDRLHKKRRRVTLRVSSSKRDRRKTEISTFVNFIHQRDAHIAMSVVDTMLLINAPIYTVHDNFITTSEYSQNLPIYYSGVFRDMGTPLSILNEFIYMNVIKPIVKRDPNGPYGDKFTCDEVISKDMLHYFLYANIPDRISKKMLSTWDERISAILISYENYTRIVCGDFKSDGSIRKSGRISSLS